jgi:hypothetical protein
MRDLFWAFVALLPAALPLASSAAEVWLPVVGAGEAKLPAAIVRDPRLPRRVAIGDERGVLLGISGEPLVRVLRRGPVRDLAFRGDGALFAATERGLYEISPDGAVADRSPQPGRASRNAQRVAVAGAVVAVATEAGVFGARDGGAFAALGGGLPDRSATAIGLREPSPDSLELWVAAADGIWRVPLALSGEPRAATPPSREVAWTDGARETVTDLRFDVPGVEVAALSARALWLRQGEVFRRVDLPLPPGAQALRLAVSPERAWLATDRGLLEAPDLEATWQRAEPPAGTRPARSLAWVAGDLVVATDDGVLQLAFETRTSAPRADVLVRAPRSEPSLAEVHRAALAHLDLGPARIEALRRGASRRGLLPILELRGSLGAERLLRHDTDETFTSGALHRLYDRQSSGARDWAAAAVLAWDLGDVAFHPEELDVAKEAREVIELRDDVLDEVTQLWFERRRVLDDLDAQPPGLEARRLALRADELAAGIDAWTGGWFGARVAPQAAP